MFGFSPLHHLPHSISCMSLDSGKAMMKVATLILAVAEHAMTQHRGRALITGTSTSTRSSGTR